MSTKRTRRARRPGELTVAVVITVRADPDQANVGMYSVALDVDGPEAVVGIVRAAYELGALSRGIDALTASVARALGPQPSASVVGKAGRA